MGLTCLKFSSFFLTEFYYSLLPHIFAVIEAFFPIRLEFYEKRKAAKIKSLSEELLRLENKVNFIMAVITGNLILANRKKIDILMDLRVGE